MAHIEWKIEVAEQDIKDLLIAQLYELGVEGMEETNGGLNVYADTVSIAQENVNALLKLKNLSFVCSELETQNWNKQWESHFDPVVIPGKVHVRAHFHPHLEGFEYELLITPKMSFGTGHHATTRMMMRIMLNLEMFGKKVIDFGTGTGILAILAEKMGASSILAIDNDSWCIENAKENQTMNACHHIEVIQAENLDSVVPCQILLANINKNVLIDNVSLMDGALQKGGFLAISGLLSTDCEDILTVFSPFFGELVHRENEGEWIALLFHKDGKGC